MQHVAQQISMLSRLQEAPLSSVLNLIDAKVGEVIHHKFERAGRDGLREPLAPENKGGRVEAEA